MNSRGWKASNGLFPIKSLSPEREGVEAFCSNHYWWRRNSCTWHSNATFDEARVAVDAGASVWVHAYNGMRGLTHRELGMVGAMYDATHLCWINSCDGHHVIQRLVTSWMKQNMKMLGAHHRLYDCSESGRRWLYVGRICSSRKWKLLGLQSNRQPSRFYLEIERQVKERCQMGIANPTRSGYDGNPQSG